jgi:hypothetical protein
MDGRVGADRGRDRLVERGGRLKLSSRAKLSPRALPLFAGDTLFDRVARVVCRADCLPRKELFESWEVARRVRRRVRGGRVVDLACGHGLVALLMLVLDDTSPSALAVDPRIPPSAAKLARAMEEEWPRLAGRVTYVTSALEEVPLGPEDVVVSAHACGALTDQVLARAIEGRARVAVLPCCHDAQVSDTGGVDGWVDAALAIDVTRAARLRAAGYVVHAQRIPEEITEKNRLLLGVPRG